MDSLMLQMLRSVKIMHSKLYVSKWWVWRSSRGYIFVFVSEGWNLGLPDSETIRQRGDDIETGRSAKRRWERTKEKGEWNTSYRVVWSMATGSINPSILPARPLLLFTAPNTPLKANLEEQKIPLSVVARSERIPEIIKVKLPNAKAAKVLVPFSSSAKFKCKVQHQHFNICIRSALGAHSSQLGSMIPVMQNFVEPLCICPVYKPEGCISLKR